jgi:hypothetical protein
MYKKKGAELQKTKNFGDATPLNVSRFEDPPSVQALLLCFVFLGFRSSTGSSRDLE